MNPRPARLSSARFAVLISALVASSFAQTPQPSASGEAALAAFIDCQRCPSDYQQLFRTEITYVDFVRDRQNASVHVLITTERTGSGGSEWSLAFI